MSKGVKQDLPRDGLNTLSFLCKYFRLMIVKGAFEGKKCMPDYIECIIKIMFCFTTWNRMHAGGSKNSVETKTATSHPNRPFHSIPNTIQDWVSLRLAA
ncbi:hypothetical protein [Peribacillus muralis]|uniref:hypothetical protein n=1 Tax=Peribacillus muralis TaxID=264697 RepID=UPI003D056569